MPVTEPFRFQGFLIDDDTAAFLAAALRQLIKLSTSSAAAPSRACSHPNANSLVLHNVPTT